MSFDGILILSMMGFCGSCNGGPGLPESRDSLEGSHCLGRHSIGAALIRLRIILDLGLGKGRSWG